MESVIHKNTNGLRATIAQKLGIAPQGLASKLNAEPVHFIVDMLRVMVQIRQRKNAEKIWADLSARVEEIFKSPSKTPAINERVKLLQTIIAMEVLAETGGIVNRFELLDAWREVRALSGKRITELTAILESSKAVAASDTVVIGFWRRQYNKIKKIFQS